VPICFNDPLSRHDISPYPLNRVPITIQSQRQLGNPLLKERARINQPRGRQYGPSVKAEWRCWPRCTAKIDAVTVTGADLHPPPSWYSKIASKLKSANTPGQGHNLAGGRAMRSGSAKYRSGAA